MTNQARPLSLTPAHEESNWASVVKDFLVDGLGMILPGLGFLFACIPAILLPLVWSAIALDAFLTARIGGSLSPLAITPFLAVLGHYHLEMFLVLVGLSYMIGHVLFRQDIKVPDSSSFIRAHTTHIPAFKKCCRFILRLFGREMRFPLQWPELPPERQEPEEPGHVLRKELRRWTAPFFEHRLKLKQTDNKTWQVEGGKLFDGMARPHWQDGNHHDKDLADVSVEFPYHYLKEALTYRGFHRLADEIQWDGTTRTKLSERTKHLINMHKLCLEFCNIPAMRLISRNEAHIRLASSVWYGAQYIRALAFCGAILWLIAFLLSKQYGGFVVVPLATMFAALAVQSAIENALHYQRCREIYYVIQMAVLARLNYGAVFQAASGGHAEEGATLSKAAPNPNTVHLGF